MPTESTHKGPGQPTKYKPEYDVTVKILAEKGFTDKDIADVFEVSEDTVNNWKKKYPQFFESLKAGKEISDRNVVQSLYHRALGYSHPEVHISTVNGKVVKTDIIKHYAPDPTSCIFWLKNRDKDHWRDKQDVNLTGDLTVNIKN